MDQLQTILSLISKDDISLHIIRLREKYPDYEIFQSVSDPDYLIFRKIVGSSKFYDTYDKPFYVNIYQDTRVHYMKIPFLL